MQVVPHGNYEGVYPDTMDRPTAREALGLEPDARVFLFLGQIRRYKGVEDLLDAFRTLEARDARLVVAGKLHYPGLEESLRDHAGDDPRIKLLPVLVPDDRMQVFLRAADAMVLPYRDVLTSGSAILAMTFGVPVLAPRIGCLPETLEECGILYDPDRKDGLRAALLEALDADVGRSASGRRRPRRHWPGGPSGRRWRRCTAGSRSRRTRGARLTPLRARLTPLRARLTPLARPANSHARPVLPGSSAWLNEPGRIVRQGGHGPPSGRAGTPRTVRIFGAAERSSRWTASRADGGLCDLAIEPEAFSATEDVRRSPRP